MLKPRLTAEDRRGVVMITLMWILALLIISFSRVHANVASQKSEAMRTLVEEVRKVPAAPFKNNIPCERKSWRRG